MQQLPCKVSMKRAGRIGAACEEYCTYLTHTHMLSLHVIHCFGEMKTRSQVKEARGCVAHCVRKELPDRAVLCDSRTTPGMVLHVAQTHACI